MILLKILLLLHFLGDFYLQTNKLSKLKSEGFKYVLLHVLIYVILFIPLLLISMKTLVVALILLGIFISHALCDYFMSSIHKGNKSLKILLIDQSFHILTLIIVWIMLKDSIVSFYKINDLLLQLDIKVSFEKIVSIILILIVIGRPTSILIESMLPTETTTLIVNDSESNENSLTSKTNYGSIIGVLERFIIVLLSLLNLWSSIALVFTAKSIARFKQLEDKGFAQKYLIGTLLSLGITLAVLLLFL